MRALSTTLFLCWVLALAGEGTGQAGDTPSERKEARRVFKAGQTDFGAGQYRQALGKFNKAFKLHPHPDIVFMIAQCHRNLKEHRQAIEGFKEYLKLKPGADDRAEIERVIEELQFLLELQGPSATRTRETGQRKGEGTGAQAAAGKVPARPEAAEARRPAGQAGSDGPASRPAAGGVGLSPVTPLAARRGDRVPVYRRWWFWAIIGGGLALAGGAGALIYWGASSPQTPSGALGTVDLR